jgi:hypothetical protein
MERAYPAQCALRQVYPDISGKPPDGEFRHSIAGTVAWDGGFSFLVLWRLFLAEHQLIQWLAAGRSGRQP